MGVRRGGGLVAIGVVAVSAVIASAAGRSDDAAKAAALAARNESLRRELELAEGDVFYLILDPDASALTLMFKGAPLREMRIQSAEIGEPRARHAGDDEAIDLYSTWTLGALYPPRINVREEVLPPPLAGTPTAAAPGAVPEHAEQGEFIEGGAPPAGATPEPVVEEVEIPKTPEELYPVPPSYEIRFAEGLTVEVVRSKVPARAGASGKSAAGAAVAGDDPEPYPTPPSPSLWERLGRAARQAALVRPEGERIRLRVVIDSLDADRLFRSLPPDVKFLIRRPSSGA